MDVSNKRPLDGGGYMPKYKPRRVSAVRDFPPRCGPAAISKSSGAESTPAEFRSDDVVTNAVDVDLPDALVGNVAVSNEKPVAGIQSPAAPIGNSGISVKPRDEYRVRSVSAVRDFPPNCGRRPAEEQTSVFTKPAENGFPDAVKDNGFSDAIKDNGFPDAVKDTAKSINEPVGEKELIVHQIPISSAFIEEKHLDSYNDEGIPEVTPISMSLPDNIDSDSDSSEGLKDMVVSGEAKRKVVYGLMASRNCPWRKAKTVSTRDSSLRLKGRAVAKKSIPKVKFPGSSSKKSLKKHIPDVITDDEENQYEESPTESPLIVKTQGLEVKAVAKKSIPKVKFPGSSSKKKKNLKKHIPDADITDDDENQYDESPTESPLIVQTRELEVNLPPFGPNSSGDARDRVRDTLRFFNAICRKLLQHEEANLKPEDEGDKSKKKSNRIDLLAVKALKEKGKEVNTGKRILGEVPGVVVGDEFQYRVELAVVGIHRLYQAGIDSMMHETGVSIATSIISSGAYKDDLENADVLVYYGQGGNVVGNKKQQPEDQKMERGNLALKNCIDLKTPVRVVRGWKDKAVDAHATRPKMVMTYVYDGLYTVERYWSETGSHGKKVYKFQLRRNLGQPELAWKELKKSRISKSREGVCIKDISLGKEPFGICAVNTIDNEKPPPFSYISNMVYPEWHNPIAPDGCDCIGRCADSKKCKCAVKNDGEIPYNRNGALVETKLLVYECGPHCKCPPSCYNRVAQRGPRYQLEIFKTESRGWGVRALASIPSGSFICEYAGELLEDTEAERRIGNDEYLFDIGQNLTDSSMKPEDQAISAELLEDGGYTIDACQYGNVGRFINHSCTPNLYAQNVIFDHRDMKMPHIMFFAMENIPPLQELTYHYNYSVNQIQDEDGNIKVKKCYCGTAECTGRLY